MMLKSRGWAQATVALLSLGVLGVLIAACSALLDKSSAQCHSNSDCVRFGAHPLCRDSVCVPSGLGPTSCVFGQPHSDQDYLNQCSDGFIADPGAKEGCVSFDNCARFGLCSSTGSGDPLVGPPMPDAGAPPAASTDGGVAAAEDATLPSCRDAAAGRNLVVYLSGSSNFIGLLGKLAPTIIAKTGFTPVFRTTDSCTGTRSMLPCVGQGCQGGFSAADHYIRDPVAGSGGAHAQYFLADGQPHDCLLGPGGAEVDVGESEIFPETCKVEKDPAHVAHIPGPILPILLVVPKVSVEPAISAEAARQVFGNGGRGVMPWTKSENFYIRGAATATTRLVGLAIDVPVPPNRFWGIDQGSAQKLAANLKLIPDPAQAQQSIGMLGSDLYDPDRANLRALGFQAKGQYCAYLPDSPFTRDKKNVRDGHYSLWGTLHYFLAQAETTFRSPAGVAFVSLFVAAPVPEELLNAFIDSSWVPECAMMVQRQSDLGPLQPAITPAFPCGCYFDVRVSNGVVPPQCFHCDSPSDCVGHPDRPVCSFHYCEAAGNP